MRPATVHDAVVAADALLFLSQHPNFEECYAEPMEHLALRLGDMCREIKDKLYPQGVLPLNREVVNGGGSQ